MAAHRYWALLVTARAAAGNGVAIAEVEMRATLGGADQCTAGTAGGTNNAGKPPANAFDNNDATIWYDGATGGLPVRLSYDFGSAVTVAEVFVRAPPATGAGGGYPGVTYGPAAGWIQWSDDGTNWFFAAPITDLSGLGNAGTATISGVAELTQTARVLAAPVVRVGTGLPATVNRAVGARVRNDIVDGGAYRIAGTVRVDGTPTVPVRRRVRLFHCLTGRLVREVWGEADGTFAFEKIALAEYLVVSDDYTRLYNAVGADKVVAVA